jgi:dipeptidyl aminopeptidase/acylaminoacyl peptidase
LTFATRTAPLCSSRWNYRKYRKSEAVTELIEFPDRTHWLIADTGWEEVADAVLTWAEHHQKPA